MPKRNPITLPVRQALILLLVISVLPCMLHSAEDEQTGRIVGRIIDGELQQPLENVQVYIESLRRGDVTGKDGRFSLDKLPVGRHDLIIKRQGYRTVTKTGLELKENQTVVVAEAMALEILQIDDVIVTASRHRETAHDVPQMVSVVSKREIRERNKTQAPELLREETGITVQKTNQGGGSAIIRGLKANKLLLLMDGIRLNNATYRGGNTQYLNTISPEALERIEVVHGPGSVLYGSDALGGVINILTSVPSFSDGPGLRYRTTLNAVTSTADETHMISGFLGTSGRRWGVILEGAYKSFGDVTRGNHSGEVLMQRLANDSRTERVLNKTQAPNGYNAYAINAKVRVQISDSQDLKLAYQLDRQDAVPRYDVVETLSDSIRLFDPQERDLVYLSYTNDAKTAFFDNFSASVSWHRQFERRIRQRFGNPLKSDDRIGTISTGAQLQFNRLAGPAHHLSYGMEVYYDDVTTESSSTDTESGSVTKELPVFPDGSTFLTFGLFIQDAWYVGARWRLNIGARFSAFRLQAPFDDSPGNPVNFGTVIQNTTALTGSIGSQYALTDAVSLVANIAQGFRTPNLDDVTKIGVGKGSSIYDVPNPEVDPEKSLSFDGGIKIFDNRVHANLIGFYNRLSDLLIRRPTTFNGSSIIIEGSDTLNVFHHDNAAQAFTAGFAFDGQIALSPAFLLQGNVSYTYGENITDSEPLTGVPPFNGRLGLRWSRQGLWTEIDTRFATEQTRLSSEDLEDLRIPEGGTPGWWTVNLQTGMTVSKLVSLNFAIANILDRNYREHLSGFNAPGRNFVLGANVTIDY